MKQREMWTRALYDCERGLALPAASGVRGAPGQSPALSSRELALGGVAAYCWLIADLVPLGSPSDLFTEKR